MIPSKPTLPAYVLALFDEDGGAAAAGDDAGATTATATSATGASSTATAVQDPPPARVRDDRGRFSIPATDDPRELKRALEDAKRTIDSAHDRIGELNAENTKHRRNYNQTKTELDTVKTQVADLPVLQQQVQAQNQRLLRAETRDALRAEGAVSDRVVDLFLADNRDKVAIDKVTGEPIGIRENLTAWKEANAAFFKAKEAAAADATADAGAAAGAAGAAGATGANDGGGAANAGSGEGKNNATASGGSLAGGGAGGGNGAINGLPDLRKLTPAERKAALADYKRSQRRGR